MLKIGIVGLPNVGKSTLFKALTRQKVDISNYPFCTIDPNIGIVKVPDQRLEALAFAFPHPNIIPAIVEFVDIAGLVKGASQGEGLGNKFLAEIREVDAILEVVRFFKKEDVIHVTNKIDPADDIKTINKELILADLQTIDSRLEKLEKQSKAQDKNAIKEFEGVKKIKESLEQGNSPEECPQDLPLLTAKPILYLYNSSDDQPGLSPALAQNDHIFLDIKMEEELSEMNEKEIKDLGMEPGIGKLIEKSYQLLNLITFFTMNENEIRAWQVKKETTTPEAGGVIHSDFEEKFIRAEIIQSDKLIKAGSWHKAKDLGIMQTVGKEYLVQDGDVIYFLI